MDEIPDAELRRRDKREQAALLYASGAVEFASFDDFRKRAAVRHYCGVPSPLLDVSTSPEVAAFFATGGGANHPPSPGSIGMLCAIDLNTFVDVFTITISSVPEGQKITFIEMREEWGDNKRMFEDHGIPDPHGDCVRPTTIPASTSSTSAVSEFAAGGRIGLIDKDRDYVVVDYRATRVSVRFYPKRTCLRELCSQHHDQGSVAERRASCRETMSMKLIRISRGQSKPKCSIDKKCFLTGSIEMRENPLPGGGAGWRPTATRLTSLSAFASASWPRSACALQPWPSPRPQ